MKIMLSACLAGENCKYNGGNNRNEEVLARIAEHEVIPVCPEQMGGLPTPRVPAEIRDGVVTAADGRSVDACFRAGAAKCLEIAMREQPDLVVLQPRSPSCGVKQRYDGTFTGTLVQGSGVTAQLLREHGFRCVDADDFITWDPTIRYYEEHAEAFAANTIHADMEDIRCRFLSHLFAGARILDFGCGTGRDAKAFRDLGCEVEALDGSEALCRIAEAHAGIPVRCLDFREYAPEEGESYDGIWACASLLHLKKKELLPVMRTLGEALKPGGIFYLSFKYGEGDGERNGRHFTDFTLEGFREYLKRLPEFRLAEHWVTGDVRPGRGEERWLNLILERTPV